MAGSTQQSFRKAFGALKDSTKVGLAKVNSDYKELDIAIVKATNHVEKLAKEKHIRAIFNAVSASRPRADVAYCIFSLARRLSKTHNWAVALKTLIVIHRALKEVDSTFREELINNSKRKGHILNVSHFKDDSSPNAWDYSAWVRVYALYLEERLECCRILQYDVEKDCNRNKELDTPDLLEQLPALQQLLYRLLACLPQGAAVYNSVILYSLSLVSSESVNIYTAIHNAILNLVDKFFEMQQHDAVRALEIYKKAANQAERLFDFYETCRGFNFGRGEKFIKIEKARPPESFLTAMEDYVKDAPRPLMLQWNAANDDRGSKPAVVTCQPALPIKHKSQEEVKVEEDSEESVTQPETPKKKPSEAPAMPPTVDLLGLYDLEQDGSHLDETNALALASINSVDASNTTNGFAMPAETAGWELALVTTQSSNNSALADIKLAGGLDKLTLDSMYDDAMSRKVTQNGTYHMGQVAPYSFEAVQYSEDPFYASNNIPPPTNVQMATLAQQHQTFLMNHQQQVGHDPTNPFGNACLAQDRATYAPLNPNTGLI